MPTYQYQCTECGEALEAVQKFTDEALTECPGCAGRLRKVFSAVGVVFKGSGFYRTDSRSSSSSGDGSKKTTTPNGGSDTGSSSSGSDSGSSSGSSSSTPTKTSSAGSTSSSGGTSAA
ncbi:FmdB family zinc ribbon protein [Streptomyces sp. TP-A0874]|uniref:FmdB family zinc ribbon protein n=1 Tax=Streptomyces sp. TP-A0874 TaxID=549819 RepID=UPI00099FFAB5|nr:FmdB family zinc ribbon protein [Streptomyces sp. TP-A0874]